MYYRVDLDGSLEYYIRSTVDGSGKKLIAAGAFSPRDGYAVFEFEPLKGPVLKLELQVQDMAELRDLLHSRLLEAEVEYGGIDSKMMYLRNMRDRVEDEIVALDAEIESVVDHSTQ